MGGESVIVEDILRISRGPSMPEMVSGRIRDMIASGALKPGDRIPPQTALASQMEVSRASVREALKSLEAGGYIQKLPNGRYRVTALTQGKLPNPLLIVLKSDPSLVWDLLEAARVMVMEAARLAAIRGPRRSRGAVGRAGAGRWSRAAATAVTSCASSSAPT